MSEEKILVVRKDYHGRSYTSYVAIDSAEGMLAKVREELSASQAREADYRSKWLSACDEIIAQGKRAEAAEARIKASQEQEPAGYLYEYETDLNGDKQGNWPYEPVTHVVFTKKIPHDVSAIPLYKQPPIPPELAELQRKNSELRQSFRVMEYAMQLVKDENVKLTNERGKLARECEIVKDRDAHNMYVATQLEQRVKVMTDGINNALYALSEEHGDDHFESECPICNAYKQLDWLLNHTPQQTAEQIERWHIEWLGEPYGYIHSPDGRMPDFHFRKDSHKSMIAVYVLPPPAKESDS